MNYYEVLVSSPQYKSDLPLTYGSNENYKIGQIIEVPFRNKNIIGVILNKTVKPTFEVKEIIKSVFKEQLPKTNTDLLNWLAEYYPAPLSNLFQLFLPQNILKIKEEVRLRDKTSHKDIEPPKLTKEQQDAIRTIQQNNKSSYLLHGDTGTGKTRVYIELISKVLKNNKSVIVLIPEIGLTTQLTIELEKYFTGCVVLIHSGMTNKNKRENWYRILTSKKPLIVLGPRSALFAPVSNLGLIIVDEAHDNSYKQVQTPYYQTTRVAAKLAELSKSKLILGSATPLISDNYIFKNKELPILRLKKLAVSNLKLSNQIELINITERDNFKKSYWISDQLINSINQSLNSNEQSIIYLNRRGTAIVILCQNCGWQALCPNCDTTLTYHADKHIMRCHSCNYVKNIPPNCPVCSSIDITYRGVGTKAIVDELSKLFPNAKISRFDRDNKKAESLAVNYKKLLDGEIDIAVGTQLITKGLDLPKLRTLGVVIADSNLIFPDYMAEERTFENLVQVIGRVGRGHTNGHVIIQTYHPENNSIVSAINKNYELFYESQILERKKFNFPPFVFLLKISANRSTNDRVQNVLKEVIENIKLLNLPLIIQGPTPAFHEKINGKYKWQIIIKAKNRDNLLSVIKILPANIQYDIDPTSTL